MGLRPLVRHLLSTRPVATIFRGFYNGWQRHRYRTFRNKYDIHPDFRFNGESINFYGDGKIVTEADSYIGRFSRIACMGDTTVKIGSGCAISHHVLMYTSNRVADQNMGADDIKKSRGDVILGDNVWLGANVFVTEDTEIGDNAVVGANAVVTHDIPPHSIAAGSPAKVRKFKSYVSAATIEKLLSTHASSISESLRAELAEQPDIDTEA